MKKWEYYYLSNAEWKERVAQKIGYKFKFLFGRNQRTEHRADCEKAIGEILNELGSEGWELVSSLPLQHIVLGFGGSTGSEMIFKREKSS